MAIYLDAVEGYAEEFARQVRGFVQPSVVHRAAADVRRRAWPAVHSHGLSGSSLASETPPSVSGPDEPVVAGRRRIRLARP